MTIKRFSVYGRVQGVAFRFYTLREAEKLGVKGYVRNCNDGSVEVIAKADEQTMAQFEQWLHHGSPSANVERVIASDYSGGENFERFEIRR
ncbi:MULTISPECIES: acylphosphatase [unclassified Mannheimia]|uniref:acylphosphatase n=1 Tax=unclassified Mannheimia TaxID=2645054 RepID=UPI00359D2109